MLAEIKSNILYNRLELSFINIKTETIDVVLIRINNSVTHLFNDFTVIIQLLHCHISSDSDICLYNYIHNYLYVLGASRIIFADPNRESRIHKECKHFETVTSIQHAKSLLDPNF